MEAHELEELQQAFELNIDFDDLEKEVYECSGCGWIGSTLINIPMSEGLFDSEEDYLVCPVCGEWIL